MSRVRVPRPVTIGLVISNHFTYTERTLILIYVQFKMHLITEEKFMSELTRLKYTKDSMNKFFAKKMPKLELYKRRFIKSVTRQFNINLSNVSGFTAVMRRDTITIM